MNGSARAADERLLETFLDLVRIDSPPGREAACAEYCAQALREAGCTVRFDDSRDCTGSDTGNLIAELAGDTGATLVLSAHLDVVEPCGAVEPIVSDGVIFSAGDTVLGADDKAGLAAAIECVRRVADADRPRPSLRCVFTVKEELGLVGAKCLHPEDVSGDLCLVLDAAGTPGGIVVGAPTHYAFAAEFTGRAAHAGVQPEAGISSIVMAAHAVGRMTLGRLDEGTTANIGTITGGTATNVVAATTRVTGECRSLDRARVEEVRADMHAAMLDAAERAGGSVQIVWTLEFEGFRLAEDDPRIRLLQAACADVGVSSSVFTTGGGSDANIFAGLGLPTVALACGMEGVHGTSEQLAVADLEALARLCTAAAWRLAEEG